MRPLHIYASTSTTITPSLPPYIPTILYSPFPPSSRKLAEAGLGDAFEFCPCLACSMAWRGSGSGAWGRGGRGAGAWRGSQVTLMPQPPVLRQLLPGLCPSSSRETWRPHSPNPLQSEEEVVSEKGSPSLPYAFIPPPCCNFLTWSDQVRWELGHLPLTAGTFATACRVRGRPAVT